MKPFARSLFAIGLAVGVVLLWPLLPVRPINVLYLNRSSVKGVVTMQLARLHQLGNYLVIYAQDHDGKYPRALSELPAESFPLAVRKYHDPVTMQESDWLYYGGYASNSDGSNPTAATTIILASPGMVQGHQRIVGHADGSAEIAEEDNFAAQLSKQLNERP